MWKHILSRLILYFRWIDLPHRIALLHLWKYRFSIILIHIFCSGFQKNFSSSFLIHLNVNLCDLVPGILVRDNI